MFLFIIVICIYLRNKLINVMHLCRPVCMAAVRNSRRKCSFQWFQQEQLYTERSGELLVSLHRGTTDLTCRQCLQWKDERRLLERAMSVGLSASVHRLAAIRRRQQRRAESQNCDPLLGRGSINPFNASCSKLLLFEGFIAILV